MTADNYITAEYLLQGRFFLQLFICKFCFIENKCKHKLLPQIRSLGGACTVGITPMCSIISPSYCHDCSGRLVSHELAPDPPGSGTFPFRKPGTFEPKSADCSHNSLQPTAFSPTYGLFTHVVSRAPFCVWDALVLQSMVWIAVIAIRLPTLEEGQRLGGGGKHLVLFRLPV